MNTATSQAVVRALETHTLGSLDHLVAMEARVCFDLMHDYPGLVTPAMAFAQIRAVVGASNARRIELHDQSRWKVAARQEYRR